MVDGVCELRDGIREFDEQGIQTLTDFAGAELSGILSGVRGLKANDDAYASFTGLTEGQTGEVKFIIETAEISKNN